MRGIMVQLGERQPTAKSIVARLSYCEHELERQAAAIVEPARSNGFFPSADLRSAK